MVNALLGKRSILSSILFTTIIIILVFSIYQITGLSHLGKCGVLMGFQTIERGYFSMHRSPAYYVIQNEQEWMILWNHHDNSLPQRSPPEVNFSESTIVAVFMGDFNTGGYGIEIKYIVEVNGSVIVKVEKTYPGKDCGVIEAFTYPYHIVKTEKIDKKITFDTVERTIECP